MNQLQPRSLQNKLRQVRSWQHTTIGDLAKTYYSQMHWWLGFENGDISYLQTAANEMNMDMRCKAYGLSPKLLTQMIDEEYEWRVSTANKTLPQVALEFIQYHNFVILDTETTGTDQHDGAEIVQLTVLNPIDRSWPAQIHTYIKPSKSIPTAATAIHGITDDMVKDAPTFREVYPQLMRALQNKIVIVYNADYDIYLIDRLIIQSRLPMIDFESFCLMKAYANYWKAPGRRGGYAWQKLGDACKQQGIDLTNAHDALNDCIGTYQLLSVLAAKAEAEVSNA
jgi:DNA polymerase-3 subunit epsilon